MPIIHRIGGILSLNIKTKYFFLIETSSLCVLMTKLGPDFTLGLKDAEVSRHL